MKTFPRVSKRLPSLIRDMNRSDIYNKLYTCGGTSTWQRYDKRPEDGEAKQISYVTAT